LFTMSDATGFNAGGSTNVLEVQPSKGGSCNTTNPQIDFEFELNTALQQCRPFVFSDYTGAVQPATIGVIIPGGNAFMLSPPVGPTSFSWDANVAQGTSMLFFMTDSQGRQGGSSDVRIVGFSDDSTCLNSLSPSSTSSAPSTSATAPSGTTSNTPSNTSTPKGGVSIAAIAGTVIGALLFLAVAITLGLFFLRKRRYERTASGPGNNFGRHSRRMGSGIDTPYDPALGLAASHHGLPPPSNFSTSAPYPYPSSPAAPYGSSPFLDSPSQSQYQLQSAHYQSHSQYDASSQYSSSQYQPYDPSQHDMSSRRQPSSQFYPPHPSSLSAQYQPSDPFNASGPPMLPGTEIQPFPMQSRAEQSTSRDSTSTTQRKGAPVPSAAQRPTRFIVHTDVEDDLLPPNEDGVVELPPQYTERRGPLNPPTEKAGPSGLPYLS